MTGRDGVHDLHPSPASHSSFSLGVPDCDHSQAEQRAAAVLAA